MKSLNSYINEKFQVDKDDIRKYVYYPKDKDELIDCIKDKIKKEGLGTKEHPLNLNDIDVSKIEDMELLFCGEKTNRKAELQELSLNGYFDISDWDVSNVINMFMMFAHSNFDGDLSDWDVSNVEDMASMFNSSKFNGDISDWDVSKVETMYSMFRDSKFTGENGDISNWNIKNDKNMINMFYNCPLQKNPPKWYKE